MICPWLSIENISKEANQTLHSGRMAHKSRFIMINKCMAVNCKVKISDLVHIRSLLARSALGLWNIIKTLSLPEWPAVENRHLVRHWDTAQRLCSITPNNQRWNVNLVEIPGDGAHTQKLIAVYGNTVRTRKKVRKGNVYREMKGNKTRILWSG